MKITAFAGDHSGCGFYRIRLPAEHAESDVTVTTTTCVGRVNGRTVSVDVHADVVVLQRPSSPHMLDWIPALRAQGAAVVVEIDDDFTCLHPSNPARSDTASRCIALACQHADLVTVSTPALARRYAPHGRVAVLPNYIPASYLHITARRSGDTVGWSGRVATHPDDLAVTHGAVARAGGQFHVIGDPDGVREQLRLDHDPTATGWVPLDRYPHELATLDVGIVPLADTAFNRAKSALKLLEMSAVGVPTVASPTPDNTRLHADGAGLLAHRPRDWERHIRRLLTDPAYRDDTATRSRATASRHTIEANAWRWDEAWARAAVNRRNRAA